MCLGHKNIIAFYKYTTPSFSFFSNFWNQELPPIHPTVNERFFYSTFILGEKTMTEQFAY